MADHAEEEGEGGDIFVYMGGRAPQHVTHVRIDRSVDVIENQAFRWCENLVQVETHDGIRRVGGRTFEHCKSLRMINLLSVAEIGMMAFWLCENLESVFSDKLEIIGRSAFGGCSSLEHLKLPSIITIETAAFAKCSRLIDVELSERLETIESGAFSDCRRLQRVAIPLKRDMFQYNDLYQNYTQFRNCEHLVTVDLVGGAHTTVASLHLESWRTEMEETISRINQVLPDTQTRNKTATIRQWMDSVLDKMDHYKAEHYRYVKEAVSLLELALWKAKLDEKEDNSEEGRAKKAKIDAE
eukprot:scaffold6708_cov133-Skeletonema_dohrnii-CCMP3373.AAC.1